MSANEGWFERNQAFLDFVGNVAAIKQRSAVIQEQLNTNALLSEKTETEKRERDGRNILYDINQAASAISKEYESNPQLACYKAIVLKDQVDEIHLNHKWFSDLQWKDYCTQTCAALADLVTYAATVLPPEAVSAINQKVQSEKLVARATFNRLPNQYSPHSISINLSTVDVKRLDKVMTRFDEIWTASTDGEIRVYTFRNPTEKRNFEVLLERDVLRSSKQKDGSFGLFASLIIVAILALIFLVWFSASVPNTSKQDTEGGAIFTTFDPARLKRGDTITVTNRSNLYFNESFYRYAEKGERFTVFEYRPDTKRLYVSSADQQGNPIVLNLPDSENFP